MGLESEFNEALRGRLNRLRNKNRYRKLIGRTGIDLSSNDYLGLAQHPAIRAAMIQALQDGVPLGAAGSRLLRGNTDWHESLEERLAQFKRHEAALIFNSGYDANVGVISTLCGPSDVVFSDALIHASMIDGIRASKAQRVVFPHNNMQDLEEAIVRHQSKGRRFIVVESLYSMDGDRAPLEELDDLARRYDALLIVDEAHATGLFGQNGAGLADEAGIKPFVAIHTCGKAWGASGAFISCSQIVKDYLVNSCRHFIFTTAPPPLTAIQWSAALDVIRDEPERAQKALRFAGLFRKHMNGLVSTGQSDTQIVPVICGSDKLANLAASACNDAGFDVRAIRPPTVPMNSARLRIAFNALLEEEDVMGLIACCKRFFGENHGE